jgi:hypothetical protein
MKKIFFTYSDDAKDVDLYKELRQHFTLYSRDGYLSIVDRDEFFRVSGDKEKIKDMLLNSDIAIPLLSVDYLNNDECHMLLETALKGKKVIIPILLRDCEWDADEKLKTLEDIILPGHNKPVSEHITEDGNEDKVMTSIARRIKAAIFENDLRKLEQVDMKSNQKTFYYIISGIVALIGILVSVYSYSKLKDWSISGVIFLMFAAIALFVGKNAFFPTKIVSK